jgi:hypothetical protein
MDVRQDLRRRVALNHDDRLDIVRDGYYLTAVRPRGASRSVEFAICESRPRGWWPIVAGSVDKDNGLALRRVEGSATVETVERLLAFLLVSPPCPPDPPALQFPWAIDAEAQAEGLPG